MRKNNFKNTSLWFFATMTALVFFLIGGCQMEEFIQIESEVSEIEAFDEVAARSLSYGTWFQQLDYLVNEAPEMEFITGQGLQLVGYELLDYTIDKDAPLNEDTRVPLYNDPREVNNFVILPLSEIKRVDPGTGSRYEDGLKKILLGEYDAPALKNVRLTWRYKNETFTTVCFVTDGEVVYDDILSHIRLVVITEPEPPVAMNAPRLKSGDENENGGEDGPVYYGGVTPRVEIYTWSHGLVAQAYCEYSVSGNRINGVNHILETYCSPHTWTSSGYYYAVAKIELIESEPEPVGDGYVCFIYACGVNNSPIFIVWDGYKYIFDPYFPPLDSDIGAIVVMPSMLN